MVMYSFLEKRYVYTVLVKDIFPVMSTSRCLGQLFRG